MSGEEFYRQYFEDLLKDRDPAYITALDLVEYGYQLALKDSRDYPHIFGKFAQTGRQVRVLDSDVEETIIWRAEETRE